MVAIVIALYRAIFTNIYLFLLIFPRAYILILQFHAPCTPLNKQHAHMQHGIKATFLLVFMSFCSVAGIIVENPQSGFIFSKPSDAAQMMFKHPAPRV